jgi:hypothetical protein
MNPAEHHRRPPHRYDMGDDEKTRPGVALFDGNDDEPALHATPTEGSAGVSSLPPGDDFDGFDMKLFRPRWHGVGRRPGEVALAVVLGLSVAIGAVAVLGSGEAQAEAADASSLMGP